MILVCSPILWPPKFRMGTGSSSVADDNNYPAHSSIWELLPFGNSGGFVSCPMWFIMGAFCPQFTIFLILPLVATNAILYLWLGEQDSWLPSKPTPLLLQGLVSRSAVWTVSFFSLEMECVFSPAYLVFRRYGRVLEIHLRFSVFYYTVHCS